MIFYNCTLRRVSSPMPAKKKDRHKDMKHALRRAELTPRESTQPGPIKKADGNRTPTAQIRIGEHPCHEQRNRELKHREMNPELHAARHIQHFAKTTRITNITDQVK